MLKEEKTALWTELSGKQAEKLTGGWLPVTGRIQSLGSTIDAWDKGYLTIDTDPDETTDIVSCENKRFAWRLSEHPDAMGIAREAKEQNQKVEIRYSEYQCFDNIEGNPKWLLSIEQIPR